MMDDLSVRKGLPYVDAIVSPSQLCLVYIGKVTSGRAGCCPEESVKAITNDFITPCSFPKMALHVESPGSGLLTLLGVR